jgi:hypothetical protein
MIMHSFVSLISPSRWFKPLKSVFRNIILTSDSDTTCIYRVFFEMNIFFSSSSARLELTNSLIRLVRFSCFSIWNSTQEFNMNYFFIYSSFFIYTSMSNYLFYKFVKTHHLWMSLAISFNATHFYLIIIIK